MLNNAAAEIQAAATQQVDIHPGAGDRRHPDCRYRRGSPHHRPANCRARPAGRPQSAIRVGHHLAQLGRRPSRRRSRVCPRSSSRSRTSPPTFWRSPKSTQQIGEIIDTVNGLADQSKLLALNAASSRQHEPEKKARASQWWRWKCVS